MFSVSTPVASANVVYEDFEGETLSVISNLKGTELSSLKPYSGQQHLIVTTSLFNAQLGLVSMKGETDVLISCFVDPRGNPTTLHFTNGELSRSVILDHSLVGYRQIAVILPSNGLSSNFTITASGNSGQFLLDEMKCENIDGILCERPQPTQMLSNYNGLGYDMVRSLSLGGKELLSGKNYVADGYTVCSDKITSTNEAILFLDAQPEDVKSIYGYAVWIDGDRNGVFSMEERVALSFEKGNISLPIVLEGMNNGTYALRIRMLDPRSNDLSDAYSGDTWGQSLDLFIELDRDQRMVACRCEQPDYYMDLSGKKLNSLEGVSAGMYIKVNKNCSEKTIVAW